MEEAFNGDFYSIAEAPIDNKKVVSDHTPITSSLLESNIFSVKKLTMKDFLNVTPAPKTVKTSHYYHSKRIICEDTSNVLFQNILVSVFATRDLDIRSFDTLKIVLSLMQERESNELLISFSDMFERLGYKPSSRNKAAKRELIARVLSLSYIQLTSEWFYSQKKLTKADYDKVESEEIERTGVWTLFEVIQYKNEFHLRCNPKFYDLFKRSHYRIINDKEYALLSGDTEKVIYRYLLSVDNGLSRNVQIKAVDLFEITTLDIYENKQAMRKAKQALKKLQEHKIISGFHVDSSKRFNISLIAQQERKTKETKSNTKSGSDKGAMDILTGGSRGYL